MALIDGKGKLFGVINIIDLFAILLLVILVYGTVSYVQYAERVKEQQRLTLRSAEHTYRSAIATMRIDHSEFITNVKKGEQQISDGRVIATILGINASTTQDGTKTTYVTVEVEGEMHDDGVFYYQYLPLSPNLAFTVVTDQHVLTGLLTQWYFSNSTLASKSLENTST